MRYLIYLIFTIVLFSNSIWAQEVAIPQEKWNDIVDYANSKVTLAYLTDLLKSNSLTKEEERKSFIDTLKPQLESSSLKAPVSYDSIQLLLDSNFKKTFVNLSSKIETAKRKPRFLDSLYNTIQNTLKAVKNEELYNSSIHPLKNEINEFLKKVPINEKVKLDDENWVPNKVETRDRFTWITLSNILIGILIILLLISIFLVLKMNKEIKRLENKLSIKSKDLQTDYSTLTKTQNPTMRSLHNQVDTLKGKLRKVEESNEALRNQLENKHVEDLISPVVTLEVTPVPPDPKEFYAGKPTPDRKFTEVSDKIKDQETVFKFAFNDNSGAKASFEVILASEFMKRQIINAPDDFLYRVCNNVNSNQDFRREIVTERKGVAHLREGYWVVDENDKALIKFQ